MNTFNDKMNQKNIYYKNPPDFNQLAQLYPEFNKYVYKNKYGTYSIDWKDKNAQRELCRTLLRHDFNLDYWDIPDGFLIPSITSRCNYIHWLHDLLEEINILSPCVPIRCLDVGTGANCIYPLLGHQIYKWQFTCSEINEESLEVAKTNIGKNNLANKIKIKRQKDDLQIFNGIIINKNDFFFFSMCNPPYFSKEEEIKRDNPNTVCEYNEKEVYCKGGEFEFISKMINESENFKQNVLWFTTLVGKKINLDKIKKLLEQKENIKKIKNTTFYQGKLVRWGIAWTYCEEDEMKFLMNKRKRECDELNFDTKFNNNKYCRLRFRHVNNNKSFIKEAMYKEL